MARLRKLKLPRSPLPEPLANALRLFGYNWRMARSRNGGSRRAGGMIWAARST